MSNRSQPAPHRRRTPSDHRPAADQPQPSTDDPTVAAPSDILPPGSRLRRIVDWLREGYPSEVSPQDYIPLVALLETRLTTAEILLAAHKTAQAARPLSADQAAEIAARITLISGEHPRFTTPPESRPT